MGSDEAQSCVAPVTLCVLDKGSKRGLDGDRGLLPRNIALHEVCDDVTVRMSPLPAFLIIIIV